MRRSRRDYTHRSGMTRFNFTLMVGSGLLAFSGVAAQAQSVISAHSGLVHHADGRVLVSEKPVEIKYGVFPTMKENETLRTEAGRAEVLLTPGAFLRVAENSSFKLLARGLSDTRVEALTGSLLLEYGEITKENMVTLVYKGRTIEFRKSGLYRIDADKGFLLVYQGEANVTGGDQSLLVKQAKLVDLNAALMMALKFDNKVGDEFYRWAARRGETLAIANVSAAKSARGYSNFTGSSWLWNSWYGMFTYVPYSGMWRSPFGYYYYSPRQVMDVYYRPSVGNYGGGGYGGYNGPSGAFSAGGGFSGSRSMSYDGGASSGSGGFSGGGASDGSSASAPAAPAAPATSGGGNHSGSHGR